ncbi:DUF3172 domain-containing protein [Nostoc sp.]|uniref:DUF3172 domain-containing protein n=1 Tax=Nostoc sp. TaxID=1180 RepID=UPI002FFD2327
MAIVGVAVLPSIILGVNLTTVTTFSPENVSKSNFIDNTESNADVCVQYDTSAIVTDTNGTKISPMPCVAIFPAFRLGTSQGKGYILT